MTNDQIDYQVFKIRRDVSDNSLRGALDGLREFSSYAGADDMAREVDALEQRYFYMLRFLADGLDIPAMEAERCNIADACVRLCDRIEIGARADVGDTLYYSRVRFNRMRPEENLESMISDYLSELTRLQTDTSALTDNRAYAPLERLATDIFERLWTTYPLSEEEEHLLSTILNDTELPHYDRELWVGALGLGQLQRRDEARIRLLRDVHKDGSTRLSAAAAVWLYVDAATIDGPERMRPVKEDNPEDFFDVAIEFARARGTEKLSEEVRDNIMPRMFDMGREMAAKLGDKTDPNDIDDLLRNSEWVPEGIDSEGFEKLKGFMDAQTQGDDVYMATLGQPGLRQFPFFHKVAQWFLPFHTGNSELAAVTDGEGAAFADTINRLPYICDSDKYAVVLAMANTPANLRDKAFQAMAGNYDMMNSEEVERAIKEHTVGGRRGAINNYVKNLYRFFRLFRRKGEFTDIFDPVFVRAAIPSALITEEDMPQVQKLAEIMMKNKSYETASGLFDVLSSFDHDNLSAVQKAGFCYEMSGFAHIASERYAMALEMRPDDLWSAMRYADIDLREGFSEKAVETLLPFREGQSDNPDYLRLLAQAYFYSRELHEASETYYNLDFILPDSDTSAKGPLAWTLTMEGDFASAEAVYSSFISENKDPEVLLNYAHLLWAQGNRMEALAKYRHYIDIAGDGAFEKLRGDINVRVCMLMKDVMDADKIAALCTVPDLLEYHIYGSRHGQL